MLSKSWRVLLVGGLMTLILSVRASATYRADFFDVSHPPVIRYDPKTATWTLRNQAIERVIHFDAKAGALQTIAFNDLQHKHSWRSELGSEGEISFAASLLAPPEPLLGWKTTALKPEGDWTQIGYKDIDWEARAHLVGENKDNRGAIQWSRYIIPVGRMIAGHAYALLLHGRIEKETEVFVDGEKLDLVPTAGRERVQTDIGAGAKVIAVKAHAGTLNDIDIAEEGSAPPPLDLKSHWNYQVHSVNSEADGSQVLTISLAGSERYESFALDVNYQIYPGDEPYIAKWFSFVSYRRNQFLIENIVFDRWMSPGPQTRLEEREGPVLLASNPADGAGLFTTALSPLTRNGPPEANEGISIGLLPFYSVKTRAPVQTAKGLTALYDGGPATGAFLYQLYRGQYLTHATPTAVPVSYNTQSGYGSKIDAPTCEKLIPLAADLGVGTFMLGDGWQTNIPAASGRYGDWVVDKARFPQGLQPISTLTRASKMRLGLWTSPTLVDDDSQVATANADWRLRPSLLCFTGQWAQTYLAAMKIFCRVGDISVLDVSTHAMAALDQCPRPHHDHPIGHSGAAFVDYWNAFCEGMRKQDPDMILEGCHDGAASAVSQDTARTELSPEATQWLPIEDKDADWFSAADRSRQNLYRWTSAAPAFGLSASAPCHVPQDPANTERLEYYLTSVAAYIPAFELQGDLEQMTPGERECVKKWVAWNAENRPWLAFTQPLEALGAPWSHSSQDSTIRPHIDGVLHLRNAYHGRYGFVCLWNPSGEADKISLDINPAAYLVHMRPGSVRVQRIKDGKRVEFRFNGGVLKLAEMTMAPHSWEILELRQAGQ